MLTMDLKPVRLFVGQSKSPDNLTSIDRIIVYTTPRASVDPARLIDHEDKEVPEDGKKLLKLWNPKDLRCKLTPLWLMLMFISAVDIFAFFIYSGEL